MFTFGLNFHCRQNWKRNKPSTSKLLYKLKLFREVARKFEWEIFWLIISIIYSAILPSLLLIKTLCHPCSMPTKGTCLQSSKKRFDSGISWKVRVQLGTIYVPIHQVPTQVWKDWKGGEAKWRPQKRDLSTTVYKEKMQVSQPNNVKIYNLSAGKSLPEVLKKSSCYILFIWKQFVFVLRFCTC